MHVSWIKDDLTNRITRLVLDPETADEELTLTTLFKVMTGESKGRVLIQTKNKTLCCFDKLTPDDDDEEWKGDKVTV